MSQYRLKTWVKQKLDVSDSRVIAIDRPYVIKNYRHFTRVPFRRCCIRYALFQMFEESC